MVFADNTQTRNGTRPKGQPYTKTPLEINDLASYIASDNESAKAAQDLIVKYGYTRAETPTALAHSLSVLINNLGQPIIDELARIHPDRDLILAVCAPAAGEPITIIKEVIKEVPAAATERETPDKYQHDCGCSHNHDNAEGHHHHKHHNSNGHSYRYELGDTPLVVATPTATTTTNNEDKNYLKAALLVSVTAFIITMIVIKK